MRISISNGIIGFWLRNTKPPVVCIFFINVLISKALKKFFRVVTVVCIIIYENPMNLVFLTDYCCFKLDYVDINIRQCLYISVVCCGLWNIFIIKNNVKDLRILIKILVKNMREKLCNLSLFLALIRIFALTKKFFFWLSNDWPY